MRYIIVICLLISCSVPENKAKKLIDEDLKGSLHDYRSYESVEFSPLKSETLRAISIKTAINQLKEEGKYADSEAFIEKMKLMNSVANANHINLDSITGFSITHKFRAKNSFGAYTLHEYTYFFDKDLKTIVDIKRDE